MSSVGGLSTSTSSNIRGYGGLASGLDRDTLIESMTQGTTSKIEKQEMKKTLLEWEQEAIRNITDKMIAFADKYVATLSSTSNLFSDTLWGRSDITLMGEFSKFLQVSGSSATADAVSIAGVKQLAQKAKWASDQAASKGELQSGSIQMDQKIQNLQGKTVDFEFGGTSYSITLPAEDADGNPYDYSDGEQIAKAMNEAMKKVDLTNNDYQDKQLSDIVKVSYDSVSDTITFEGDADGNKLELTGGSALRVMGINLEVLGKDNDGKVSIANGSVSSGKLADQELVTDTTFLERVAGKDMTFTYNGVTKTIKIASLEELRKAGSTEEQMAAVQKSIQEGLDGAFGSGRIEVKLNGDSANGYQFGFETRVPGGGADNSSVLEVVSASDGLLGKYGAFNMASNSSNRINLNAKIADSGMKIPTDGVDADGNASITINGKTVTFNIYNNSVADLMEKINQQTDVTISYQKMSDKFAITSDQEGASGKIEFGEDAKKWLGTNEPQAGQDAVIAVKYNNTGEVVEFTRGSNTFDLEGLTVTVSGTFGYKDDGNGQLELDPDSQAVTFDAKVDTDKVVETVKKMVEEINEIISIVNTETTTRPDREFAPLTDAQKKELSEDEIETWEKKAKAGLLFNDNDMKSLSNELRYLISSADLEAFKEIGITTSSSYNENGKLEFDETKFKAALEADPEKVKELFTKKQSVDASGNVVANGLAVNMKNVMDKYAKTLGATKGILVERAGNVKAPLSITNNAIYKRIAEVDKVIASLQDRLQAERDRFIKQFTTLESLISEMNSQSSYLSGFFSY